MLHCRISIEHPIEIGIKNPRQLVSFGVLLSLALCLNGCQSTTIDPEVHDVMPLWQYEGERRQISISGKDFVSLIRRDLDSKGQFSINDDFVVVFTNDAFPDIQFTLDDVERDGSTRLIGVSDAAAPAGWYRIVIETPYGSAAFPERFEIRSVSSDTDSPGDSDGNSDTDTDTDPERNTDTAAATCSDGRLNQDETGVDCGGNRCPPCDLCADFSEFGPVEEITGLGLTDSLHAPTLSRDGLTMYFVRERDDFEQIYVATRTERTADFSVAVLVSEINGVYYNAGTPFLSANGERLYFYVEYLYSNGDRDIAMAVRDETTSTFTDITLLDAVNSSAMDHNPFLTADELTLFFSSDRAGAGSDGLLNIWFATREAASVAFSTPTPLEGVNTAESNEGSAVLSRDRRTLFFSSDRSPGKGNYDIWRATRSDPETPFSDVVDLPSDINSAASDYDVALSFDESELFFASSRNGKTSALYRTVRTCVSD